jgi:integrase/recombinase XerD
MATDITTREPAVITLPGGLPALIEGAGDRAAWRFVEFFTATIRNVNTRAAYARAVARFLAWCEGEGLSDFQAIRPVVVAAYIETFPGAAPSVKQHLAAIRQCFDWLVAGGVLENNPAASVRGRGVSSNGAENRVRTSSLLDRCAITVYSRGYGNP